MERPRRNVSRLIAVAGLAQSARQVDTELGQVRILVERGAPEVERCGELVVPRFEDYSALVRGLPDQVLDFAERDAVRRPRRVAVRQLFCGRAQVAHHTRVERDPHAVGAEAIRAALAHNFDSLVEQQPEISNVLSQPDLVVLIGHERGLIRATGEPYDVQFVQRYTFRGGKLAAVQVVAART